MCNSQAIKHTRFQFSALSGFAPTALIGHDQMLLENFSKSSNDTEVSGVISSAVTL